MRLCDPAAIPSSGDRSSSVLNSGSNTTPSSGQQAQAHPLSEAWNIDPAELAVCQFPDGSDWLLGTGSFGELPCFENKDEQIHEINTFAFCTGA